MSSLPPEARTQALKAYQDFHDKIRLIAHDFRASVKDVLGEIDKKHVDDLHQKIQKLSG